jgi:preprotein translocase subunit SecG
MEIVVLIVHVLTALSVIGLVLLQHGKGADMGAAFGSGSAGSLFGASGSANFLSRSTAILATVFFLSSLGLTYFSFNKSAPQGVMSTHEEQPAAPASAIPTPTAPAPAPAQAGAEPGSKADEIPK